MGERGEILMRIVVGVVSGITLSIWKILVQIIILIHALYTLISGKRIKDLAQFCNIWNTQVYDFLRYMTFVSNKRPFPFEKLRKNIDKYK